MNTELASILQGIELKRFVDEIFKDLREKYNLKKIELEVMYALRNLDNCDTPSEIAQKLMLNRGHVSQAIDSLYKRNLILPIPDEKDRRYMHYRLTEEANEISNEIYEKYVKLEKVVLSGISQEELEIYTEINNKLMGNIHSILEDAE